MKILVVSHSCVIDVNQKLLVELVKFPDVRVGLVVPEQWRSDIRGKVWFEKHPELKATVFPMRVALWNLKDKNVILHFYLNPCIPIKKFKPDIIYIQEEPWSACAYQYATIGGRAKKFFFTEQNIYKNYPPPFSLLERYIYNNTDGAIAVSQDAKEVLRKKGYRENIYVIPHGVDLSLFQATDFTDKKEILKKELGLNGVVVGYIGRITEEKGLDTLINAMHLLVTRHSLLVTRHLSPVTRHSLLIIGSGPYEGKIRELVEKYGIRDCIKLVPAVPHSKVPLYLSLFDITVLPSKTTKPWKEQFGRVLIESMALGIPVIGSSSGEIPNIIESTGGGIVFEEGNSDDLAEKILILLRNPQKRLNYVKIGKENVQKYSYQEIAKTHYELFHHLFKDSG